MQTEIQKLKGKIAELKTLTSINGQRDLAQMLRAERRATAKPLKAKQAVIDRIYSRWEQGRLALDPKTVALLKSEAKP
tara:strand:+ start:502 stop:735 length:234 start_codon:yes stop_codon:yes gene_type:complete